MSKKILKRSLALGALMAFVITGSAMAAEADYSSYSTTNTNTSTGKDYFEDTKWRGEYYSNLKYPNGDQNSLIQIEVIHTDEFKSWDDFEDTHPGLEERYYPGCEKLEADVTLNGSVGFVGYNDSSSNASYNNTDLNGHKLTVNHSDAGYALESSGRGGSFVNEFYETFWHPTNQGPTCQYKHIYTGLKDLVLDLPGFNICNGDLEINSSNVAILGYGKIDVDELKITSDGNAIQSELEGASPEIGHKMEIYANSMEINTKGNAIQVYNTLDIIADKLEIKAKDTEYARAIRVANSTANGKSLGTAIANIDVEELNLNGASESSKVSNDGVLNLTAKSGKIVNDFEAASTGTIDVKFGAGVNWTGKYITDTNATKGALDLSGTWNLTEASSLTNATFNAGSTLVIEGKTFDVNEDSAVYALNGVGNKATLTVENGAKLNVTGIKETTYNVATGFAEIKGENYWTVGNMADLNNNLMEGKWLQDENKNLQLQIAAKEADTLVEELGVSETTGEFLNTLVKDAGEVEDSVTAGTAEAKLVGLANAAAQSKNPVVVAKAAEALQKMAEAGGNSATAANVVNNVTNVTGQRMSFTSGNNGNKGGHGVGLLEEGSGAAIWAQYVHGKDSVEDMPSEAGASSYEGQYNGSGMGVDFKKVGKFQSGIAFNYGEGDTHSVNTTSPTRSDYDFWGIGYYGNIRNADSNVIFDIGYAKTDSDVTSNILGTTFEASPETTTWTAGVKVEKLYQNNNVQIVPYTGLRYMSIDPEDYSTKCGAMGYKMERQDIWLLPLGVSIRQEVVNNNGWVVTPKVDLSYIWAFGDTDSSMETNTVFGSDNRPIGYDVMDDGSWMGLVGVEAAMDDWTFGVSYSYQKGDHSESKKWYVDAKYSF